MSCDTVLGCLDTLGFYILNPHTGTPFVGPFLDVRDAVRLADSLGVSYANIVGRATLSDRYPFTTEGNAALRRDVGNLFRYTCVCGHNQKCPICGGAGWYLRGAV